MREDSLLTGNITKYALIASELRDEIVRGQMAPDEQLPPFPKMLERFGVAKHTLERAYALLEQEGLIRREQGRGIFVQPLDQGAGPEKTRKKETGFIGYLDLWPQYNSHSPYALQLQKGMRQAASEANKHLVLIDSPETFVQWDDLDGLLLSDGGKIERHHLRRLIPENLRVVNLLFDDPVFPSVIADDAMGSRLLVEHLISLGHEKIGFLGFYRSAPVTVRYQAYRETMLRNRIEPLPQWLRFPDGAYVGSFCKAGHFGMQSWLAEGFLASGCTAVITQNDQMAFGIIRALQEADISVPGDVSIAGFDGVPHIVLDGWNDDYWQPLQLTTIKVPLAEIAAVALNALLGGEGQLPAVGNPLSLPVELQKGESSSAVIDSCEAVCVR